MLKNNGLFGSMGRVGAAGDNARMESFHSLLQKKRARHEEVGDARGTARGDRPLYRADLSPSSSQAQSRPHDASGI